MILIVQALEKFVKMVLAFLLVVTLFVTTEKTVQHVLVIVEIVLFNNIAEI